MEWGANGNGSGMQWEGTKKEQAGKKREADGL